VTILIYEMHQLLFDPLSNRKETNRYQKLGQLRVVW
jgi:hypothetical protein